MKLTIGTNYQVKIYGFSPRTVIAKYTGRIQPQTLTQKEVHGFKCSTGTLGVLKSDLKARVSLTEK